MNDTDVQQHAPRVLIVDDTPENLHLLQRILSAANYRIYAALDGIRALKFARATPPDLIFLDIKMPGMDGYAVCEQIKANEATRDIPVIFISALNEIEHIVQGFEVGGVDYITKPFHPEEVLARAKTHLLLHRLRAHLEDLVEERTAKLHQALTEVQQFKDQLHTENIYFREEIKLEHNFEEILGQSEMLNYLLFRVKQVAATDTPVLITGETGTGKELIARAIHARSHRSERPLVKVNCAALPAHLIESELFGHEKGAFTGAASQRIGRFELADGATLFLDEIGELPLEVQPKLLRVLQEGEFERVGSSRTRKVDVRMIAATNRNLADEIRVGRFRQDLYYRLDVYPLSVPPLRNRPEDIPILVQTFVQRFSKKVGKTIEKIPLPAMEALQRYAWPGNIRELQNVIERAVITTSGAVLQVELPETTLEASDVEQTLEAVERAHLLKILQAKNWRINGPKGAAAALGLHPETLRSRLKKLGIQKP